MNKAGIIYATRTKHSKKLAEAVGQKLLINAVNINANPVLGELDLLFIVGGIYGGESMPELLEYVKSIDAKEVKTAALITSCGSKRQKQESVRSILNDKGIKVLDEFVCQGSILFVGIGHPNEKDVEDAVSFASRILEAN